VVRGYKAPFSAWIEYDIGAGTLSIGNTPVCHMAVVSDPDGNSVTIHKRKAS
jgi:hypothetical protein